MPGHLIKRESFALGEASYEIVVGLDGDQYTATAVKDGAKVLSIQASLIRSESYSGADGLITAVKDMLRKR